MVKNSDVANIYAQGTQEAKTKTLFIEGKVIYSYGYHFPISYKIGNIVIFNSDGYSNTTARHKGAVKRALESEGYKLYFCNTQKLKDVIQKGYATFEELQNDLIFNELEKTGVFA